MAEYLNRNGPWNPIGDRLYAYGKNRTDFYSLARYLKRHDEWHMGHMWASTKPRAYGYYGKLASEHYESVSHADYVVFSYDTPIAWETYGIWHMPEKDYSSITRRHKSRISVALSVME